MKQKRVYSARFIVTTVTFATLLVQVFIFYLSFSEIDVFNMLETSTYRYYNNRLEQGAEKLESKLVRSVASREAKERLLSDIQLLYLSSQKDLIPFQVNDKVASDLLQNVSSTEASGALVLLNKGMQDSSEQEDIFFIRDSNTDIKLRDNSDIMLQMGSSSLAKRLNISLDNTWTPKTEIGKYKAENIAKLKKKVREDFERIEKKNPEELAFWLGNVELTDDGNDGLVYVQPIVDIHTNTLYGMLVFELNSKVLSEIIDVNVMPSEFSSGFALIQKENDSVEGQKSEYAILIDYFGDHIPGISGESKIAYKKIKNKYYSGSDDSSEVYLLDSGEGSSLNMYGFPKKLRLYNKNSTHYERGVYLVLFLAESNFYFYQSAYVKGVIVSIVISILFAVLLSMVLSHYLTLPVSSLVGEIESVDITKKIQFKKTRIKEMDLLAGRIENLSYNIGNFYFKMQNLMEMFGKAVVILEEDASAKIVYKTGRISAMLGESDSEEALIEELSNYNFELKMKKYSKGKLIENEKSDALDVKIIGITNREGKLYLKYEKKYFEGRWFHIYMDYTQEYDNILKLEKEKNYDFLTSLPNRKYFKELVTERLEKHPYESYAMIMWDLDNLKYINDMFGHDWGDTYLKATADVISTLEGDTVYVSRFSGDEFFAFLKYDGDKEALRNKLNLLQTKLLNSKIEIPGFETIKIRASVGLSWYPDDANNYDDLYKYTDFAMYQAKHTNKGTIAEFDSDLYEKENIVILGKEDLNRLIEQKLVKFAFQPVVSVKTGEIFGYEALMRSKSESINSVDKIMKLAKHQYKLPQIENLTFEGVFDAMEENKVLIKDKKIFINSIASVLLPEKHEQYVRDKLAKYSDQVVIEITESEEVNSDGIVIKKNYRNKYGTQIAIDDFGSGYSTETSLLEVNPDFIKIDMVIIRDIHKDKNRYQLVKSIVEYSKIRGIKIIAEGVETEEELYTLIELDVDLLQGYYLSKPSFDIKDISAEKKEKVLSIGRRIREAKGENK